MASTFTNVLSGADISYIHQLPQVVQAKSELLTMTSGVVNISFVPTESIRLALNNKLGLDLQSGARVPLRWIKGDTTAHSDRGSSAFSNTHLVYLNNSVGEFVVNGTSYPIVENTGFKFHEGVVHKTTNAGVLPRLLIGPLAETGTQVGLICFLQGSQILCNVDGADRYVPIEKMTKGMLVKTYKNGYKALHSIGTGTISNRGSSERIVNHLYKCSPKQFPELKEDLFITGAHSILVNSLTDKQRGETRKTLGDIYITDDKYRLPAYVDERCEPMLSKGNFQIWHIALDNDNIYKNYGVYANGLLVESCSINYLTNKSSMTLA